MDAPAWPFEPAGIINATRVVWSRTKLCCYPEGNLLDIAVA
jgi:hypothetical protein